MNKKEDTKDFFWITNITKKIVNLSDINVVIYPMRSLNLMDKKHYSFKKEQLIKSAESGSLKAKEKMVVVRKVPPVLEKQPRILIQEDAVFQTRQRSSIEVENIKYEELDVSDDQFAAENADTAETDHLGKWTQK